MNCADAAPNSCSARCGLGASVSDAPVGARTSVRPARWQHVGRGGINSALRLLGTQKTAPDRVAACVLAERARLGRSRFEGERALVEFPRVFWRANPCFTCVLSWVRVGAESWILFFLC